MILTNADLRAMPAMSVDQVEQLRHYRQTAFPLHPAERVEELLGYIDTLLAGSAEVSSSLALRIWELVDDGVADTDDPPFGTNTQLRAAVGALRELTVASGWWPLYDVTHHGQVYARMVPLPQWHLLVPRRDFQAAIAGGQSSSDRNH